MAALTQTHPEVAGWTLHKAMFKLHGAMLLTAFIVLYPAGVITINSGSSKSLKYHWTVQLAGSVLGIVGVITGLVLSPDIRTAHHKQIGVLIGLLLGFQLVSGWRHHMIFLKIHRRTWISSVHIWLGRFIIALGWCNFVLGLSLGGYADGYIYLAAGVIILEAILLAFFHYRHQGTAGKTSNAVQIVTRQREASENQFALGEDSSDDDDDDEHEVA